MAQNQAPISTKTGVDELRSGLDGALGESNFARLALGFGARQHLGQVGIFNATWAAVALSGAATITVDVPHRVRGRPTLCWLVDVQYPDNAALAPQVTSQAVQRTKWGTTCRMAVRVAAGTLDGATGWFIVGGE